MDEITNQSPTVLTVFQPARVMWEPGLLNTFHEAWGPEHMTDKTMIDRAREFFRSQLKTPYRPHPEADLCALHTGVLADPESDAPRLVYADRLQELDGIMVECPDMWGGRGGEGPFGAYSRGVGM